MARPEQRFQPLPEAGGAQVAPRPSAFRQRLRAAAGLLLAALLLWLVFRGYQQPGMLLEFANFRLC
jgi:hypothetical protein